VAQPIKIVRVITRLNVGGPAINAILLTAGLKAYGYQTVLVRGVEHPTEGSMDALADAHGVRPLLLRDLQREPSPSRDLRALGSLYRLMRRERPTIVHTHTAKAGTLGRLAAALAGVPVVVHTFHGHVLTGYFGPAKSFVYRMAERALASRTTRIVAVGEAVKRDLVGLGVAPERKFRVIRLGLDLEPLFGCEARRGQLRRELGLAEEHILIGIVARLVPIKAHEDFFRAAALVSRSHPLARFIVVGDGERRPHLEALVRDLGLEPVTHFLGIRRDMDVVYGDLDVVALSSLNEGLPISIIEAKAAGRAVVATDVGSVGELVRSGTTGIVVPPRDPEAMARALTELADDEGLRRRMGEVGRDEARRFAVEPLLANTASLYHDLLVEKGLNPPGPAASGREEDLAQTPPEPARPSDSLQR